MTIKKKFGIEVLLLAILLIGVVFVASASTNNSQGTLQKSEISGIDESELQENHIPDFGPHVFDNLRKDSDILSTKGQIPQYVTQAERQSWLYKLDKSKDILKEDMRPYLYPNGPIIGYGWDTNGYFEVTLYKGITATDSQINEIYNLVSKGASKESIQEIPVVFKKDDFIHEAAAVNYSDRYRPLIGAIQIATQKGSSVYIATLGFAAKKSDGTKGYVTAKHFANSTGLIIYQPTKSLSNEIGDVDILGGHYADASFIEYSNVQPKIHIGDGETINVTGYFSDVPTDSWKNWTVYMSGRTSGLTRGKIVGVGVTINQKGWIYFNQVKATFPSASGDSGAPVFCRSGGKAYIIGIFHGYDSSRLSYFSPLSGVISDLGVRPLVA